MVGSYLKLRDVKPGQTVRFAYYSGSTPGDVRTVKVHSNDGFFIKGTDQDKDAYRQFCINQAGDGQLVEEATKTTKAIYFTDARDEVLTALKILNGEQLAAAYGKLHGVPAKWNSNTGYIEIEVDEPTVNINGSDFTKKQLQKLLAQLDN